MLQCCGNDQKWPFSTIFPRVDVVATILGAMTWPSYCQISCTTCGNEIGTQSGTIGASFLCFNVAGLIKNGHFPPFFLVWMS